MTEFEKKLKLRLTAEIEGTNKDVLDAILTSEVEVKEEKFTFKMPAWLSVPRRSLMGACASFLILLAIIIPTFSQGDAMQSKPIDYPSELLYSAPRSLYLMNGISPSLKEEIQAIQLNEDIVLKSALDEVDGKNELNENKTDANNTVQGKPILIEVQVHSMFSQADFDKLLNLKRMIYQDDVENFEIIQGPTISFTKVLSIEEITNLSGVFFFDISETQTTN